MSISQEDVTLAIKVLADSKDAITDINAATTAMKQYLKVAQQANTLSKNSGGALPSIPQADIDKVNKLNTALGGVAPGAAKAGKGLISFANFARTAFGTLTASWYWRLEGMNRVDVTGMILYSSI